MNKNCNNKDCYYYNTCLIDNNNPHNTNFQAITRGNAEKKG